MKKVLVTGSNGQLATCIKELINDDPNFQFVFKDIPELDITNKDQLLTIFNENNFSWCINCAAYTNVDQAEANKDIAYAVNQKGAYYLAQMCKKHNANLIHISTDFVFNGESNRPYTENVSTDPIGVYGDSKLAGEKVVENTLESFYIIRTSWLYSEHGHNFLKTMLKLSETRDELNVIYDQVGTPTYAKDLASFILKLLDLKHHNFGIYHYSNEGVTSWYDFSKEIFALSNRKMVVNPIKTEDYKTLASRPHFSVLDKTKTKNTFNIQIPYWRDSLKTAISKI